MQFFGRVFVAFMLLVVFLSPSAEAGEATTIYSGKSSGYTVKWTTSDLQVLNSQEKIVFSAKKQAESDFRALIKDREKGVDYSYQQHYQMLSLVGPILSICVSDFETCSQNNQPAEAHPGGATRYFALDLRSPERLDGKITMDGLADDPASHRPKMFVLNRIFPEKPLLKALSSDRVIKEAASDELDTSSLKALVESLDGKILTGNDQCGTFDSTLLNSFAFHHVETKKNCVAVRLGISGAGACRYNLTQLGILLPIPAQYKTWFDNAASKKEGILMRDLHALSKDKQTDFEFTTKRLK